MKIVKGNCPESIYQFLLQGQKFYDHEAAKGTLSITTLLKPIQAVILQQRHDAEIEVDAMSMMRSVLGSGCHAVLEGVKGYEPIGREYAVVEGVTVSGKTDVIDTMVFANGEIVDYKMTSVWTVYHGDRVDEWREQLSGYRWLHAVSKGVVASDTGKIVAIMPDWRKKEYEQYKKRYPAQAMTEILIKLNAIEETEKWVRNRVLAYLAASCVPDNLLPPCTDAERWWNYQKKTYMRCEKYCSAVKFCSQAQQEIPVK